MTDNDTNEKTLWFDTETTGLPSSSYTPRICQIAWIVVDGGRPVAQACTYLRLPPDVEMQPGAARVHGITADTLEAHGVRPDVALGLFCHHLRGVKALGGHNLKFDRDRLADEMQLLNGYGTVIDSIARLPSICTMELTRDICQLPPTPRMLEAGYHGFKSPRLTEAYERVCGRELVSAHDALVDVLASYAIYAKLQSQAVGAHDQ